METSLPRIPTNQSAEVSQFINLLAETELDTLKWEDDFKTQVMTLNGPMNMRHSNYVVSTEPFHLISDLNT